MTLQRISIMNYKNILAATVDLSPKMNCLIGSNGMGKTNFLDAIYFLSFCHSAFNAIDSQTITHDRDFFVIEGLYTNERGEEEQRRRAAPEQRLSDAALEARVQLRHCGLAEAGGDAQKR